MKKIFLALLIILFCQAVGAEPPKQVIFFGDSLSDNGNLYRGLFKQIPKSPPYFNGRFSNGPSWAEYLEQFYLTKYNVPSLNYGVGGATVVLHSFLEGFLPYNLAAEVDQYLFFHPFVKKDQILFIIWMGANDYLNGASDVNKETSRVVNETKGVLEKLIRNGAQHLMILNLPDLAKIPYAQHALDMANLHQLTVSHNQKLSDTIKALQTAHPNVQIIPYDIYSLFDDIILHIDKYNQKYHYQITHLIEACWPGGYTVQKTDQKDLSEALRKNLMSTSLKMDTQQVAHALLQSPSLSVAYQTRKEYDAGHVPCDKPDEYLFWDQVHPSGVVHNMLAQIIIEELLSKSMKA